MTGDTFTLNILSPTFNCVGLIFMLNIYFSLGGNFVINLLQPFLVFIKFNEL